MINDETFDDYKRWYFGNKSNTILNANETIGGVYRVIEEIGRGGTGIIYKAYHTHLQKYVVLKRLKVSNKDVMSLRQETDILKNLHHSYLPQVYDFIVKDNAVFTVMDYIPGHDLEAYPCGAANLPEEYILRWLRQMAEVLVYLENHDPPVIHSDIKPANIIIQADDDNICLIDFNISIAENAAGKIMGLSRNYASPEQCFMAEEVSKGKRPDYALDTRTDIYSTGATFYKLMSGQIPAGGGYMSPKLGEMGNIGYSPGLCAIIDKCMAWNREDRYPNAKAFLHAIDHVRKQDPAYKRYVALKATTWLVSALLVSAGIWCIFHGIYVRNGENYSRAYATMAAYEREGRSSEATESAFELLNNEAFDAILEENPEDMAQICHILGDVFYERKDYSSAAEYYGKAVDAILGTNSAAGPYYRDYAISLAYAGRTTEAAAFIEEHAEELPENASLELVAAVIAYQEMDYQGCLLHADEAMRNSTDREVQGRACRVKAQAYGASGDLLNQQVWLRTALDYSENRAVREEYAALCMDIAQNYAGRNDQKRYAEEALASYEKLISLPDPSINDKINCGITYYYLTKYQQAVDILKECYEELPGDYRIPMYLALSYSRSGDLDSAYRFCTEALSLYEQLDESNRELADMQGISLLKELEWQLKNEMT